MHVRSCLVLLEVLLVACTAHTSHPTDAPVPLTCSMSIVEYCATNPCDQTLAAAKQDRAPCPASLTTCGNYDVVVQSSVYMATSWYYQGGQLVAISDTIFPSRHACLAGPATFEAPTCTASGQTLPSCVP